MHGFTLIWGCCCPDPRQRRYHSSCQEQRLWACEIPRPCWLCVYSRKRFVRHLHEFVEKIQIEFSNGCFVYFDRLNFPDLDMDGLLFISSLSMVTWKLASFLSSTTLTSPRRRGAVVWCILFECWSFYFPLFSEAGWNPLHHCSSRGHKEICEILIKFNSDVNSAEK
jgi:hypothetical protein